MSADWLLKSTRSSQFFFRFGLGRQSKFQFRSSLNHVETFWRWDERVKIGSHALNFVSPISDFVGLQVRYYRRCLQSDLWFSCHFGYARYELIQLDKCIGKIKVLSTQMRFQKYVFCCQRKYIDRFASTLPVLIRFRLSTLKRSKTIELYVLT